MVSAPDYMEALKRLRAAGIFGPMGLSWEFDPYSPPPLVPDNVVYLDEYRMKKLLLYLRREERKEKKK